METILIIYSVIITVIIFFQRRRLIKLIKLTDILHEESLKQKTEINFLTNLLEISRKSKSK